MHIMHSRIHLLVAAVSVAIIGLGLVSPAAGAPNGEAPAALTDAACAEPQLRAQVVEILVGKRDTVALPLHVDVTTTTRIDEGIRTATSKHLRDVVVSATRRSVTFHAKAASVTERGIFTARATGRRVSFALRTVPAPEHAYALAIIRPRTPADADAPTITALGSVCSLMTQLSARHSPDPFTFLTESRGIAAAIALFDSTERISIPDPDPAEQGVIVRATHWAKLDEHTRRALRFFIANRSDRAYELASLSLSDERGTRNHAAQAWLEPGRLDNAPIVVQPGAHVEGWLWVDDVERLGRHATLVINEPQGEHPRVHKDIPVWTIEPADSPEKDSEIQFLRALNDALLGHEVKSAFLRELVSEYERVPIEPRIDTIAKAETARDISVRATAWFRSPRHLILAFDAINNEAAPVPAAQLAVLGEGDSRDHAGAMFLGAKREGPHIAVIPPKSKISGLVFVREPETAGGTIALYLRPAAGAPVMQTRIPVIDLTPPQTPEEIRDAKARGRVSLQLKMLGGVITLPSGLNQDDSLSTTSLKGLGARITYGFNRYWSMEAEAVAATSGTAMFRDITFDGQPGDLERGATVYRGQFGAVVGFGDQIVPSLRAGIGAQGESHNAALMTPSGERMPGPDLRFDFGMLVYAGIGLDLHISDHLVANLGLTMESPVSSNTRSFEASLHIGYGWPP